MQPIFPFELGHKSRTEQPNLLCLWHMEFHTPAQVCCMLHPPLRRSAMMFHYVRFGIALAERCWTTFFSCQATLNLYGKRGCYFGRHVPESQYTMYQITPVLLGTTGFVSEGLAIYQWVHSRVQPRWWRRTMRRSFLYAWFADMKARDVALWGVITINS